MKTAEMELTAINKAFGLTDKQAEGIRALMLYCALQGKDYADYVRNVERTIRLDLYEEGYFWFVTGYGSGGMSCEIHEAFGLDCDDALEAVDAVGAPAQGDYLKNVVALCDGIIGRERAFALVALGDFYRTYREEQEGIKNFLKAILN